jgi:hypothetical protein
MTKNSLKIANGLVRLVQCQPEVISGTVVMGSFDATTNTLTILPTNSQTPIEGVMISSVSGVEDGVIVVPKEGSHVVIASIDGPGIWTVVKTCEIEKAILKIGSVTCTAESTGIIVECGNTTVDIGTIIKIGTAGESLFGILNDLLIAMTLMTVTTSTGPSSVPINLASFNALQTRLGNLLSA